MANPKGGTQNLTLPLSVEEARKRGRNGGIKSGEARRRKKTIAETAQKVLDTPVTDKNQLAMIKKAGLPVPAKPTYRDFLVASIVLRTVQKGRPDDLGKLMDILGEAPAGAAADGKIDDGLSRSLRELAEELTSDD